MRKFNLIVILVLILNILIVSNSIVTSSKVGANDVFAHYTMDSITNGKVKDVSGNNRDASAIGSEAISDGVINKSIDFLEPSYLETKSLFRPSGSFSISLWFKHSDTKTITDLLIGNNDYSSSGRGFEIGPYGKNNGNQFRCAVFDSFTYTWFSADDMNNRYADNNWHNIILVFNSASSLQCFMDGKSLGNINLPGNFYSMASSTSTLHIGNEGDSNMGQYTGFVDDVQIFNYALSNQEVNNITNLKGFISTNSKTQPDIIQNLTNFDSNFLIIAILTIIIIIGIGFIIKTRSERMSIQRNREYTTQNEAHTSNNTLSPTDRNNTHTIRRNGFCVKCNSKIEYDDHYCMNCGTPIIKI